MCSEQPPDRAPGRLDANLGHREGACPVVEGERAVGVPGGASILQHRCCEIGIAPDGGGPAVGVQKDDGRSPLALPETTREVLERRLVTHFQVGA
jgi:hypothetical protein